LGGDFHHPVQKKKVKKGTPVIRRVGGSGQTKGRTFQRPRGVFQKKGIILLISRKNARNMKEKGRWRLGGKRRQVARGKKKEKKIVCA